MEINKYHTSKIYKISSPQCEKFYIGSTTQKLNIRLSIHKSSYKRYIEKGIGSCFTSFEVVKFDDCIIELVKNVNCNSKKELEKIEGECIKEQYDRILNKRIEGRTYKEWCEINKDKMKEYREANKNKIKEHYENNKEKLHEKFDCECGGKYTFKNKALHAKTQKHQLYISNQQS